MLLLAAHRHGEVIPITYARLVATAHMSEFVDTTAQRRWPVDHWATAADWQRMSRVEDRFVYRRVAAEAGKHEAHPPAFYWLMHTLLSLGVGDHWTPTLINLPGAVLTGGLVVAFVWWLTRDAWCVVIAGLAWCFSPLVMLIGDNVRSPTLFAPFTLLLVWLTLDWARRPAAGNRGALAWRCAATLAVSLLGELNHFQMAVAIAGCGLFLTLRNRRAVVPFAAAVVVAVGLFFVLHPHALGSLKVNADANAPESVTAGHFALRVFHLFVGLLHFLAIEPKWTRAVTLAVPLAIGAAWLLRRRDATPRDHVRVPRTGDVGLLTGILLAESAALYLGWRVPPHAYGTYYFPGLVVLTPVWIAVGLRYVVRTPAVRAAALAVMLAGSLGSMANQLHEYDKAKAATAAIGRADAILTDAAFIRGVPRVVDDARPAAAVLVADRARLAADAPPLLAAGQRVVFALDRRPRPDNVPDAPDALDALIRDGLARGTLYERPGLEGFSPEFVLYCSR